MTSALNRAGAEELITPREIIRDYLTLLNILRDNKGANFRKLVSEVTFATDDSAAPDSIQSKSTPPKKIGLFDIDI